MYGLHTNTLIPTRRSGNVYKEHFPVIAEGVINYSQEIRLDYTTIVNFILITKGAKVDEIEKKLGQTQICE